VAASAVEAEAGADSVCTPAAARCTRSSVGRKRAERAEPAPPAAKPPPAKRARPASDAAGSRRDPAEIGDGADAFDFSAGDEAAANAARAVLSPRRRAMVGGAAVSGGDGGATGGVAGGGGGEGTAKCAAGGGTRATRGANRLFAGVRFMVSGLSAGAEREAIEASIRSAGGSFIEEAELLRGALERRADASTVLLCAARAGGAPKRTHKLLFGLAHGLTPLKPTWAAACLRAGKVLPPRADHLAMPGGTVAPGATADARRAEGLLAGRVVVTHGSDSWMRTYRPLLRLAGAVVRAELPTANARARASASAPEIMVLYEPAGAGAGGAGREAACARLVERARKRGLPARDDEWLKRSLMRGTLLR